MMKKYRLLVITSLVLVPLIIATGVIFAQGMGAVNQGTDSTAEGDFSTVSGGRDNNIPDSGDFATISGGGMNTASGPQSTIGGGQFNTASGELSTIGGGDSNSAEDSFATIGGGDGNRATDNHATVGGGLGNRASGEFSTVGGGAGNTASGVRSTVPGGDANTAGGDFSFAAGRQAQANHNGTFVWADSTDEDFASTGENQFLIRASGGVGIGTDNPTEQLTVNGKVLAKAFVRRSAAQWKTDIQTLEGSLERIQALRGVSYDWKADGKHDIGLIAEEVGKVIPEVVVYEENGKDAIGVDYAGLVPVLVEAVKEQQKEIEDKDAQIASLEARIAALEESGGAKGAQTGLLPFSASVMWMLAGGLGLLLVPPGLVLGSRRIRKDE